MHTATTGLPQLLGISGSLRRESFNTAIVRTLGENITGTATLNIFSLQELPLYNQDLEQSALPQSVLAFKAAIAAADGIVISSPEYNYGIPGVLKNALDWASRPAFASPFKNKPVLIITASPSFTGGARAQAEIKLTLTALLARVVARPEIVINNAHEKIKEAKLIDTTALKFALEGIADLIREIRLVNPAQAN